MEGSMRRRSVVHAGQDTGLHTHMTLNQCDKKKFKKGGGGGGKGREREEKGEIPVPEPPVSDSDEDLKTVDVQL